MSKIINASDASKFNARYVLKPSNTHHDYVMFLQVVPLSRHVSNRFLPAWQPDQNAFPVCGIRFFWFFDDGPNDNGLCSADPKTENIFVWPEKYFYIECFNTGKVISYKKYMK